MILGEDAVCHQKNPAQRTYFTPPDRQQPAAFPTKALEWRDHTRQIWGQPDKATAARVLDDWIRRAEASCIKVLQKFAATLAMHRTGILAYYDCRISTGPLEGTNNKIKTMQRQAYGFRDQEFFKLKIYAIHESKYALVG
jgi:transposase